MTYELKPCPFCGGEAKIFCCSTVSEHDTLSKIFKIKCPGCGIESRKPLKIVAKISDEGESEFDKSDYVSGVQAWNRRYESEVS